MATYKRTRRKEGGVTRNTNRSGQNSISTSTTQSDGKFKVTHGKNGTTHTQRNADGWFTRTYKPKKSPHKKQDPWMKMFTKVATAASRKRKQESNRRQREEEQRIKRLRALNSKPAIKQKQTTSSSRSRTKQIHQSREKTFRQEINKIKRVYESNTKNNFIFGHISTAVIVYALIAMLLGGNIYTSIILVLSILLLYFSDVKWLTN